ncbi:MAG TPA: malonyl CoA-acyl carrier protein transacylase, partial [Candidatus Goldiibacteriota bacterium]|nr:malonyl CoA-acyl carrier protein transacylase [Candidatus Goldiibacteriota bacterium]
IDAGEAIAKSLGAKRYVKLAVAGAFHSDHMASAAQGLKDEITGFAIRDAIIPVISNFLGREVKTRSEIESALINQVTGPVKWVESVLYMKSKGVDTYIEIGPGSVLSGLIKKIDKEAKIYNIDKVSDVEKLII